MSRIGQRANPKLHRSRHQSALDRPELREPSSPRQAANPAGTFALKVQRSAKDQEAIERYLEAKRLAQIGQDFAREGIELVEEGLERAGAKRVSAS